MTEKTLTYSDLDISLADVSEQMGYGEAVPDDSVLHEMQVIVGEVQAFLRPRFCFFVSRGTLDDEAAQLNVNETHFDIGPIIARQLRHSEAFAFFVCTAGTEYEHYQQQLKATDDQVRTFIADALGSVIAEKCADRMEIAVQQSIDKLHWQHTNRFSPGYCGWHVSQQQLLFPLFYERDTHAQHYPQSPSVASHTPFSSMQTSVTPIPCGVRLTESSLMVPIKSVSGIIGLGPEVRRLDYTCGLCDFKQCYKRRRPSHTPSGATRAVPVGISSR